MEPEPRTGTMGESPPFRVEVELRGAGATLIIHGDVDIAVGPALEQARTRALAAGPDALVIDLRGVGFIDSRGLRFLIETQRLSERSGWKLELLRPSETAMKVFVVTGTDAYLPFRSPQG